MYEHPEEREAYRLGARAAYESAVLTLDPLKVRELDEWLKELDAWQGGNPPDAPFAW